MVNIIDESLDEKLRKEKFDKMVDIAVDITEVDKEFIERHSVYDHSFAVYSNSLHVWPRDNEIVVYGDEHFEIAKTLAKKYEDIIKEDFTLTKKYKAN